MKSHPELWAECSDAASLARHLGRFGEIRITKLEPETAVAWEGNDVSGTVTLEASGWGTRVVLTATEPGPPGTAAALAPDGPADLAQAGRDGERTGLLGRLLERLWRRSPAEQMPDHSAADPEAGAAQQPGAGEPESELEPASAARALGAALDSLGMAHHRPYSRT